MHVFGNFVRGHGLVRVALSTRKTSEAKMEDVGELKNVC